MVNEKKTCKACGCERPIAEFYRSPVYPGGRVPKCKACVREYDQELMKRPRVAPSTGMKRCCRCQESKAVEEFHARARNTDGLRSECKACTRIQEHAYRNRNPEKERLRRMWQKYGLTEQDYHAMVHAQDGRCAICQADDEQLVVDHCHGTGLVRGLLCTPCNSAIGMLRDDPAAIQRAKEYVEFHRNRLQSDSLPFIP